MDYESFIKALENLIITLEWYFANCGTVRKAFIMVTLLEISFHSMPYQYKPRRSELPGLKL